MPCGASCSFHGRIRTLFLQGKGTLGTNTLCLTLFPFRDGERKGSLSLVKRSGPAADLVPELRTSYCLLSCVNFTIHVPPNLDRHFLAHFQKDVTHDKEH